MSVSRNKFFIDPVSGSLTIMSKALGALASLLIFIALGYFLWDIAGDAREEEVVARYEAIATADKEAKLKNFNSGKDLFETQAKETEIRYVDRVKEVTKFIKQAPTSTEVSTSCILTPDFIRVYNDESASSK